jgi:hypothetical protein
VIAVRRIQTRASRRTHAYARTHTIGRARVRTSDAITRRHKRTTRRKSVSP